MSATADKIWIAYAVTLAWDVDEEVGESRENRRLVIDHMSIDPLTPTDVLMRLVVDDARKQGRTPKRAVPLMLDVRPQATAEQL